jgi:hypothetical protein
VIRTKTFTIPRSALVRAASGQYFRRMWPIFIAFPAFGVVAFVAGPNSFVRAIGLFAILWPLTIPARVALSSWGKAKKLMSPTWVLLEDDALFFHDDEGSGMKLPLDQVRRADKRAEFYVLETRRFNFALIPVEAVEERERGEFEQAILTAGSR